MGGAGIFCGNFCTGRGKFPPCQMMWSISCYVDRKSDGLPNSRKYPGVIIRRNLKLDMRKEG